MFKDKGKDVTQEDIYNECFPPINSNKLIAEFMGVGKHYEAQSSNMFNQYHTDWNRLISVIHKCFDVAEDGQMSDIMHHLQVAEMGNTYDAVVEFIKDYNNGKN